MGMELMWRGRYSGKYCMMLHKDVVMKRDGPYLRGKLRPARSAFDRGRGALVSLVPLVPLTVTLVTCVCHITPSIMMLCYVLK